MTDSSTRTIARVHDPAPGMADRPPPTNVIAALCRVMEELPTIAKEIHRSPGGEQGVQYPFRSIEQITPYTQDLFAKYGLVLAPYRITDWQLREITVREKPWTDDRVTVLFRCYGPGGRDDFIELEVPGIGRDNSDKGSNKAMTAAMKYALSQMLQIAGDDPDYERAEADRRSENLSPPVITPHVADGYLALARKRGFTETEIRTIVLGVTADRTEDVRYLYQTELDALTDATRDALAAKTAGEAAGSPGEPSNASNGTETAPDGSGASETAFDREDREAAKKG